MFQAYSTYWPDGYTAQYAWAAAWMCKYDTSACPEAIATFNGEHTCAIMLKKGVPSLQRGRIDC